MLAKQEKTTHILMVHAFLDIHGHWGGLLLLYQHKRIVSESRIQDVEVPLQLCAALQVGHIAACRRFGDGQASHLLSLHTGRHDACLQLFTLQLWPGGHKQITVTHVPSRFPKWTQWWRNLSMGIHIEKYEKIMIFSKSRLLP